MNRIHKLAIGIACGAALGVAAWAQSPAPANEFQFYTTETLAAQIKALGNEIQSSEGVVLFQIKVDAGGALVPLTALAGIDTDTGLIEVAISIATYNPAKDLPAPDLLKLVAEGEEMDPVFFSFRKGTLWIRRFVDNRQRDSAAWKRVIEDLGAQTVRTLGTWNSDAMKAQEVKATPASPAK